jgi:hypothetical protein
MAGSDLTLSFNLYLNLVSSLTVENLSAKGRPINDNLCYSNGWSSDRVLLTAFLSADSGHPEASVSTAFHPSLSHESIVAAETPFSSSSSPAPSSSAFPSSSLSVISTKLPSKVNAINTTEHPNGILNRLLTSAAGDHYRYHFVNINVISIVTLVSFTTTIIAKVTKFVFLFGYCIIYLHSNSVFSLIFTSTQILSQNLTLILIYS